MNSVNEARGDLTDYVHSICGLDRVSAEEEVDLANRWREHHDEKARQHLINANLRLVIACTRSFRSRGMPLDELVAEGNIGLIRAVDRFDPSVGCRFSTYAVVWIQRAIAEAFVRQGRQVLPSRHDRADAAALNRVRQEFAIENGREPTTVELSERLGMKQDRIESIDRSRASRRAATLPDDEICVEAPDEARPDETAAAVELRSKDRRELKAFMSVLTPAERRAIELRFGLAGGQFRSVISIAEIMCKPRREVATLLQSAITRMSSAARTRRAA